METIRSIPASGSATRLAYALVAVFVLALLLALSERDGHRPAVQPAAVTGLERDLGRLASAGSHAAVLAATGRFLDDYQASRLDRPTAERLVARASAAARPCADCVALLEASRSSRRPARRAELLAAAADADRRALKR